MANSSQPGNSIVDAFFRLFSSEKSENTPKAADNLEREWKRQNSESVPGIVRPMRSSGEQQGFHSNASSSTAMRYATPIDAPVAHIPPV